VVAVIIDFNFAHCPKVRARGAAEPRRLSAHHFCSTSFAHIASTSLATLSGIGI
jgi:hypothetical protein